LPEKTVSEPARLRLDAAVPDQVNLGQTFDLAVAVRQVSSPPLAEDGLARTRSGEVQVAWHPTESYSHLRIQVSAPDCEIQGADSQSFRLYPGQDSPVFYFQLIPKKLGEISVVVRVYQEDDWLGSTRVHTAACEQVTGRVQIETVSQPVSVHRTDGISNKRLPDQVNLTNLRQVLTTYFNDSELRDLCFFELRIDYDGLRGEGKEAKIRELIAYCERHGRIPELLDTCKQLRPNVRDQA